MSTSTKGPEQPLVAVITGADSALEAEVVRQVTETLEESGIPTIVKQFKDKDAAIAFAKKIPSDLRLDIGVIIVACEENRDLANLIAADALLPVIGIPIVNMKVLTFEQSLIIVNKMVSGTLNSIVGINDGKNAATMAFRILASGNFNLTQALTGYLKRNPHIYNYENFWDKWFALYIPVK